MKKLNWFLTISVPTILMALIFCGCVLRYRNNPAVESVVALQSEQQNPMKWLEQEEAAIWQELNTQYGFKKEEIEQEVNAALYTPEHAKALAKQFGTGKEISPEVMDLVHEVIADYGINKNALTFLEIKAKYPPAGIAYGVLMINPVDCSEYPRNAQKFILAHELTHFVHRDGTMLAILTDKVNPSAEQLKDPDHILNRFSRFHEMRADMSAALIGPEYTEGLIKFMEIEIAQNQLQEGISHPTYEARLAMGNSFINEAAVVA